MSLQKKLKEFLKDEFNKTVDSSSPTKILGYMKKVEKNMDEENPEELSAEVKKTKLPLKEDELTIDGLQKQLAEKDKLIDELQKKIVELSKPSEDIIFQLTHAYPYLTKKAIEEMPTTSVDALVTNAKKEGKIQDGHISLKTRLEDALSELGEMKAKEWTVCRDKLIKVTKDSDESYTIDELEDMKKKWEEEGKKPIVEVAYLVDNLKRVIPKIEAEFVDIGLPKAAVTEDVWAPKDSQSHLSDKFKVKGGNL